ncbi:DNA-binding transcription factor [Lithospermum erythrorhizon]|uniref:DNA-binding transcription factor n=1 Tax=Lithospermum erythrorhizon TaxID=34254 RepID=A0AAV3NHC3_LITER
MASSKKQLEGIALLSIYADDEDDDIEAEEAEVFSTGLITYAEELQVDTGELHERTSPQAIRPSPNMQASPPRSSDRNDLQEPNAIVVESGPMEIAERIILTSGEAKESDPVINFLPPPPMEKCSEELQVEFENYLNLRRSGRSYNADIRKKKGYRNPDFLLHTVTYQDIDQIGSCFIKDVFDPHGYDESDFYDSLEADMTHEMETREQERKKSQKLDFISVGSRLGTVIPTPKLNLPIPAANLPRAAADGSRDGRANKKSKWDKVDGEAKSRLPSGVQDAVSVVLRNVTYAGSGYSAFASCFTKLFGAYNKEKFQLEAFLGNLFIIS